MAEIGLGLSALKAAYDIAKGLKDIDDRVKLNAAIIDLQAQILDAQQAAGDASDRLRELEAEVALFRHWEVTAARYALKDYGAGTFAYELRPDKADGEPSHRLCPSCFEDRKRGILQFRVKDEMSRDHYKCSLCARNFEFGVAVEPPHYSADYDPFG